MLATHHFEKYSSVVFAHQIEIVSTPRGLEGQSSRMIDWNDGVSFHTLLKVYYQEQLIKSVREGISWQRCYWNHSQDQDAKPCCKHSNHWRLDSNFKVRPTIELHCKLHGTYQFFKIGFVWLCGILGVYEWQCTSMQEWNILFNPLRLKYHANRIGHDSINCPLHCWSFLHNILGKFLTKELRFLSSFSLLCNR